MSLIEKEGPTVSSGDVPPEASVVRKKVVIVDGMTELQSLDKPAIIRLVLIMLNILQKRFSRSTVAAMNYTWSSAEDIPLSLKSTTRVRRRGDKHPVYYWITDSTHIAEVTMKRLLSHEKTKMELFVQRSNLIATSVNGAWGNNCQAIHRDVTYLRSSQSGRGGHKDDAPRC